MKTAVCFFGIPRKIEENLGNILSSICGIECDRFAHFWTSEKLSILENAKLQGKYLEPIADTRAHAYVSMVYDEKTSAKSQYEIGGIESFGKEVTLPGWIVRPSNITSMWNSMSKSVSLALSYASSNNFEYDRIVLIRTDVVPDKYFDLTKTFIGDVHQFSMPSYHPGSRIPVWLPDHIISMSTSAARSITFLPQFSYHY